MKAHSEVVMLIGNQQCYRRHITCVFKISVLRRPVATHSETTETRPTGRKPSERIRRRTKCSPELHNKWINFFRTGSVNHRNLPPPETTCPARSQPVCCFSVKRSFSAHDAGCVRCCDFPCTNGRRVSWCVCVCTGL